MKNLKSDIKKILLSMFVITTLTSCEDNGYDDYGQDVNPTVAMNGEWWINISDPDGNALVEHALHKTYDTNMGDGKMYITDRVGSTETFTGWWLESPVTVNVDNLTFSATGVENTTDGSIVNITDGKILKNAGHSRTGVVVDSIYFKGEFDYDPGTILTFAGTKRTGFEEDEY